MTNYLEVKNLSKSFDSFQLHNITFTLPKGYIMGLIGPNGSGKTTTIKLILNMLKRNGGEIKIMGLDNIADEQKAKAELGVVFDTNYFSDDWKVSEVEKSISVFYPNWNSERFSEMLRKFHIAPTKKVKELSKGMQMKLMLACAFSYDAKLLILDEPTSGLDPVSRDELLQILSEYIEDGEHSVLFSTHITGDLERAADYITYISYGELFFTGRKDEFAVLRKERGLSGFPKRNESSCDSFDAGHSSNSISAGLGYVRARDLLGEKYHVVSVIGDGALTGGMAYEALNNAAELDTNFIIVLNDNNMSISKNVGGMSNYLSVLRTAEAYTGMKISVNKAVKKIPHVGTAMVDAMRRTKSSIKQLFIPGMLFENMGLTYLGPVDGHNMRQMMRLFNEAKRVKGPVVVHVLTEKGRGYEPARRNPDLFHGISPFDVKTGKILGARKDPTYTEVFSNTLCKEAQKEKKLVAITAAMPDGTGLKKFSREYPERFFDVGIAEEHAVSFAAGLALGGMIPVVAIYSSFLQRAVDQMLHDVCMQNLHVIFAIDRAGLVGAD